LTTTIWERTDSALSSLGVPYAASKLQIATGNDYPDLFMVYFSLPSTPEQHADNKETLRSYMVQVNVFSRGGLINLPDVDEVMTAAGFTKGREIEIPLDQETGHYGLGTEFLYIESED
jgi:hypothetical protein